MKLKVLSLLLAPIFAWSAVAEKEVPDQAKRVARPEGAPEAGTSFIVGTWRGTHPRWKSTVEFRADGLFVRPDGTGGHWLLTADHDHPLLVLRWESWGTESLDFVGENHFSGPTRFGVFDLVRDAKPAAAVEEATKTPEFHTWKQGDPPVKLIPKDEGFCALTTVSGGFAGGGEGVWVSIGEDGYWYLGGRSQAEAVTATCIVIRYESLASSVSPKETLPALTGVWYASGDPERKCEIRRDGDQLSAKNELADATRLRQDGAKFVAEDWDGSISGVQTGDAILWSNETYWTKAPLR